MKISKKLDALDRALASDRALTRILFEREPSLARLLPYGEVLSGGEIFLLKDGSLGAVLAADLLEHEPMTRSEITQAVQSLKSWLSLPPGFALQVIYDQSHVAAADPVFKTLGGDFPAPHPVSKMLFDERLQMLHDECKNQSALAPMRRSLVLALRYFPPKSRRLPEFARTFFAGDDAFLEGETEEFGRELKAFRGVIAGLMEGSKVPLRYQTAAEVAAGLRRFFNPKAYDERSFAPLSGAAPLSEQVIYRPAKLDFAGIEREGVKTRTISLKTCPELVYPGGMAYFTRLPFPYRLALNFSFPEVATVKKYFDLKEFFLENAPSARGRRQRDEILKVQGELASDNRCLHVTMTIVVEGESDDELTDRTRAVLSLLQNDLGSEGIVEEKIGLGLCLNTLPLFYTPKADHSSQRFIRILRSDATKLLPVFDSFRGLKDAQQLYLSRERNLVPFSLTGNETSNHTVVLADTGSGKSAFVIDCIQAAKRSSPEPLVFVIDKKSSYLMLSEYFDADLTIFGRHRDIPFSPFRGIFDEEKVAFLVNLIASGVKLLSPSFKLESEHLTLLAKAIEKAHDEKLAQAGVTYVGGLLSHYAAPGDEAAFGMEDVVAALAELTADGEFERYQEAAADLIRKLGPFYKDGIYAPFFKAKGGGSDLPRSKLFFIYDLDALDTDPTLQALMTMAVVEEIRQTIKLPEHKGRGGFIVLEELGMLGRQNPYASKFIADAAETFRKLGYWLIGLTPRPQNYFETDAGKAMWGAADNFIFLQMSEDNARYLAERSSLLDEAGLGIVKSLRTVKGEYADVYYVNKKKTKAGAFRFVQTRMGRWLSPTNLKDFTKAEKALKRHGNDKWQALAELAGEAES